ncbi:MAG TPA: hypothetical protein VHI52_08370 [Verrucomicrobiae bacterium]|nr:hypothetical protein [Verrucomicrobiae bacterium]
MISQTDAELVLEPYLVRLRECIRVAWKRWEKFCIDCPAMRKPLTPRTRANFLYDHIVEIAEAEFLADRPKVFLNHSRGFLEIDIDSQIVIRFKKLNKKYKASNIQTHQQVLYSMQSNLFGPSKEAARLVCGYLLTVVATEIKDIAITCPNGSVVEWFFSIADQGNEGESRGFKLNPINPQDGGTDSRFKKPGEDDQEIKDGPA